MSTLFVLGSASTASAQAGDSAPADAQPSSAPSAEAAPAMPKPAPAPEALPAAEAPPPPAAPSEPIAAAPPPKDKIEAIVVTGSRIARTNLSSPVPVTIVDSQFLENAGSIFLADILAQTPQLQPSFTSANSTRLIGTAGFGGVNLRNLGIDRTLLLVNGRRHVGSAALSPAVDLNTIPVDLIARFDVLTGGASAIYGADAVAGVVNVVLREDFDGFIARAQYNISGRGDAESYFVSATAGTDFAEGKGNAVLSLEYTQRDQLASTERDFGRTDTRTLPNPEDMDSATVDDGVPDEILTPNAGLNFINRRGVVFPTFGPSPRQQTFNDD
ncbi:MAG: TonB-dependent receptor plug domain-containing protein, partial [Myxococcota bacterium]